MAHFLSGSTAPTAARLRGVNRKTTACFFYRLRQMIAIELAVGSETRLDGGIEVDERDFRITNPEVPYPLGPFLLSL